MHDDRVSGQAERAEQLGDSINGHPELVAAALPELEAILREPDDLDALEEVIIALGHAWDPRAAALLVGLVDVDHSDDDIRLALARSLPGGATQEPIRSDAIRALVKLSADQVDEVRDWACFGLGQLDAVTLEVRDALAARLDDADADTRCEALFALAKIGDPRALPACLDGLAGDPDDIYMLVLKAAGELADPALLSQLQHLASGWAGDDDAHSNAVAYAIRRCDPEAHTLAAGAQERFVLAINELLSAAGLEWLIFVDGTYPHSLVTLRDTDRVVDADFGERRLWDDTVPDQAPLDTKIWLANVISHIEQHQRG